ALPRVAAAWKARHGHEPNDRDVRAMYDDFLPLQKETLAAGSHVIPGVVDAIAALRQRGMKIGSTTGYTRALMDVVVPPAALEGYSADVVITTDDVPAGRPDPAMNRLAVERLGGFPMESVVVVDDTLVGIEAGQRAGAITVAVTQTGNAMGLSQAE